MVCQILSLMHATLSYQKMLPYHSLTTTCHLTECPSRPGGIVRLQYPRLRLVRLGECIPPLFLHALYLPDFPYCFLKLLHPSDSQYGMNQRVRSTYLGR